MEKRITVALAVVTFLLAISTEMTASVLDDPDPFVGSRALKLYGDSNYLVVFHDQVDGQWDIYARPVSSTGQVGPRITISNAPGNQEIPFAGFVAFDGTHYLLAVADGWGSLRSRRKDDTSTRSSIPWAIGSASSRRKA